MELRCSGVIQEQNLKGRVKASSLAFGAAYTSLAHTDSMLPSREEEAGTHPYL